MQINSLTIKFMVVLADFRIAVTKPMNIFLFLLQKLDILIICFLKSCKYLQKTIIELKTIHQGNIYKWKYIKAYKSIYHVSHIIG